MSLSVPTLCIDASFYNNFFEDSIFHVVSFSLFNSTFFLAQIFYFADCLVPVISLSSLRASSSALSCLLGCKDWTLVRYVVMCLYFHVLNCF